MSHRPGVRCRQLPQKKVIVRDQRSALPFKLRVHAGPRLKYLMPISVWPSSGRRMSSAVAMENANEVDRG